MSRVLSLLAATILATVVTAGCYPAPQIYTCGWRGSAVQTANYSGRVAARAGVRIHWLTDGWAPLCSDISDYDMTEIGTAPFNECFWDRLAYWTTNVACNRFPHTPRDLSAIQDQYEGVFDYQSGDHRNRFHLWTSVADTPTTGPTVFCYAFGILPHDATVPCAKVWVGEGIR